MLCNDMCFFWGHKNLKKETHVDILTANEFCFPLHVTLLTIYFKDETFIL